MPKHIFPLSIVAAIVEETIFCVHGGLSPDTYNPEMVSCIKIYIEKSNITFYILMISFHTNNLSK